MAGAARSGGRAASLDLFKTLLVWGMIGAHCIQLLAFRPKPAAEIFADFINVITFSGFMLAFGLGIGLSSGGGKNLLQRLWPVLLLLAATFISETAFEFLVDKQPLTQELMWNIVTLTRLYGWSEFLASFAVLYLVIAVARPALLYIGSQPVALVIAIGLCFASTFYISDEPVPTLPTIIGTTRFASFPLLSYLPWFLCGIAIARMPMPKWLPWLLATLATGTFGFFVWRAGGELPRRFPPTILWVVGAALPLLIYLATSRAIAGGLPRVLLGPGRHVLASLIVSNLVIFSLRWGFGYRLGAWWWTPFLAVALIAAVTIVALLLDRRRTV